MSDPSERRALQMLLKLYHNFFIKAVILLKRLHVDEHHHEYGKLLEVTHKIDPSVTGLSPTEPEMTQDVLVGLGITDTSKIPVFCTRVLEADFDRIAVPPLPKSISEALHGSGRNDVSLVAYAFAASASARRHSIGT